MRAHHQDRKIRESVHEAMQGRAVRSAGHPQVHEGRERAHSAQAICLGHGSGGDRGEPPVPERLGEIVGQRGIILDDCDEAISPSGAEELDQPVEGRGFRQHGKQTFLPRGEQIVLSGVSGDHDRRQPGVDPSDLVHQTRAAHHQRISDFVLPIQHKFLRQYMENILICGDRDGFCRFNHAVDIFARDDSIFGVDTDHASAVGSRYVFARDSDIGLFYIHTRHQLRFLNHFLNAFHRRIDVDDHPFAQALRIGLAHTGDVDCAIVAQLRHKNANLGRSDVEPNNM